MSRRVPLSRASVVMAELRRCSPQLRWDHLPHDACSDDAEIDAAMRKAVDSYHAEGYGSDELADRWQSLSLSDLVMAARWAESPQVFDFDPDLAAELASTEAGSLPAAAVELPYPIQYIRCRHLGCYDGFLAWTDRDFDTGKRVLSLVLLERKSYARVRLLVPFRGTIGDLISRGMQTGTEAKVTVAYAEVPRYAGPDDEGHSDMLLQLLEEMLSMLLYICSDNPDVETAYHPPKASRGSRPGPRTNPETVHKVGARIGRELGAARRAQERGEHAATGCTMPPHVRAAHFTHYWVGHRKGRTDGRPGDRCIVHWIPPIAINGGGGEEVVHPVRMR